MDHKLFAVVWGVVAALGGAVAAAAPPTLADQVFGEPGPDGGGGCRADVRAGRLAVVAWKEQGDAEFSIWNLKTGERLAAWTAPHPTVSLALSPDGATLLALGGPAEAERDDIDEDPTERLQIRFWNAADGKPVHTFDLRSEFERKRMSTSRWAVQYRDDGSAWLTGAGAWTIEPAAGGLVRRAFGSDVVLGRQGGVISDNNIFAGVRELRNATKPVPVKVSARVGEAFADAGRLLVSVQYGDRQGKGDQPHIAVRRTADGEVVRIFAVPGRPWGAGVFVSPSGRFAALVVEDKKLAVVDTTDGSPVKHDFGEGAQPLQFTDDGVLVVRDLEGRLRFFDPIAGKVAAKYPLSPGK